MDVAAHLSHGGGPPPALVFLRPDRRPSPSGHTAEAAVAGARCSRHGRLTVAGTLEPGVRHGGAVPPPDPQDLFFEPIFATIDTHTAARTTSTISTSRSLSAKPRR
ncbi:hypothetical protein GCM10009530_48860 [Microbispora corallina]|uniref:Uncharacterized protein n=1 Tax=Microbispora corallina TaxID=83302 RepID=A0ABQ4G5V5_9ACTN|nr:hypothetical protein Mco01_54620 [Microbispora corallina]